MECTVDDIIDPQDFWQSVSEWAYSAMSGAATISVTAAVASLLGGNLGPFLDWISSSMSAFFEGLSVLGRTAQQ